MEKMIRDGKYSHYFYEIWAYMDDDYPAQESHYFYKILDPGGSAHYWTGDPVIRDSNEDFDTAQEAEFAAIGHIDLLESGEG